MRDKFKIIEEKYRQEIADAQTTQQVKYIQDKLTEKIKKKCQNLHYVDLEWQKLQNLQWLLEICALEKLMLLRSNWQTDYSEDEEAWEEYTKFYEYE